MKLNYRADMRLLPGSGIACDVTVGGKSHTLLLDTWADALVNLTAADYEAWGLPSGTASGRCQPSYSAAVAVPEAATLPDWAFVKTSLSGGTAVKDTSLSHSTLGLELLRQGLLSIDFPHQKIYYQPFDLVAVTYEATAEKTDTIAEADGRVTPINKDFFVRHIFDYRLGGNPALTCRKPVVIDFWATWCIPCKRLMPEIEKFAEEYRGRVSFYKVNADLEKELGQYFNVQALPTLIFIPTEGDPIVEVGATPEKYRQIIEEKLLGQ